MRINSEGIPRDDLIWAWSRPDIVRQARRTDSCLLCRRPHVNEAALCDCCWATLDDNELRHATRWTMGMRP